MLDLGARACNCLTPVGPPPPFCIALLTAHGAPPALRATGININNGVQGRRRGSGAGGHRLDASSHTHTHTCTHTHTHAAWQNFMEGGLCLHGIKVASPCQRLTFALAHTPDCTLASFRCDGVKHAQHLYSHTPVLAPAQWPRRVLAYLRTPPPTVLVRIARNSAMPQKWYKRETQLPPLRRRLPGYSWRRMPAHGASSALSNSATQLSGCQGHRTVSAGTRRQLSTQALNDSAAQ